MLHEGERLFTPLAVAITYPSVRRGSRRPGMVIYGAAAQRTTEGQEPLVADADGDEEDARWYRRAGVAATSEGQPNAVEGHRIGRSVTRDALSQNLLSPPGTL